MSTGLILTLIAFLFVAFSLLSGKVAPSVACGVSVAFLWVVGVLDMTEVFANFVSSNIIMMVSMMIVIGALLRTSILSNIAGVLKTSKGVNIRHLLIVGMLIPFVLCQFIGGAASMYLMKNQIITNVGGSEALGFWDLCFTRMPGTIVTIIFVVLVGYKLLPQRELADTAFLALGYFLADMSIPTGSLTRWIKPCSLPLPASKPGSTARRQAATFTSTPIPIFATC